MDMFPDVLDLRRRGVNCVTGYRKAGLRLCFRIMQIVSFLNINEAHFLTKNADIRVSKIPQVTMVKVL